jgi:hypothetical protein
MMISRIHLRRAVVVLAALDALAIFLPLFWTDRWREADCKRRLQTLHFLVADFSVTHDNRLPRSIDDLPRGTVGRWILVCPATVENIHQEPENGRYDYSLMDWSSELHAASADPNVLLFSCPQFARYPLICDAHLSNHGGRGINVILVDGTVFWDEDGAWLRDFAKLHPNKTIPVMAK